ncbi:hypothetical protein SAMD00019534_097890 [Acytostelium subglobosum LB1]|uniref:hypothetical protein n=1 Tax=Acytostelium subglobosum LB1 TaxID=1410327 RepID=UPI0006451F56|nr:hypothetical protein SAMD00019534_097890 [Acytostelium subglobosum LB1]GAM26614.1 hypothetical protein SAMD00019534_097890 [Acytostelium subglobosum LB1]|eukprot:XP_012750275.1 hypothetical protein SAMD00019534_097890 [Acytostelium subglobosum LB1]
MTETNYTMEQIANQSSIEKVVIPPFPVIDRDPSHSLTTSSFRASDYLRAITIPTALTTAYYFATYRHKPTTAVWAAIAFPLSYLSQYDIVQQRLRGYRMNKVECAKHNIEYKYTVDLHH